MSVKAYAYGDDITQTEFEQLRERIKAKGSKRLRKLPQAKLLEALDALAHNRLEHEVNRMRGIAFDSGEAGFSHKVVSDDVVSRETKEFN